jgi:hypothetical protein
MNQLEHGKIKTGQHQQFTLVAACLFTVVKAVMHAKNAAIL